MADKNNLDLMETIINFRELGSIKTKDNAVIRSQQLFRSAAPEEGSKEDIALLKTFKIDEVIDFRGAHEKNRERCEAFDQQFPRSSAPINVVDFLSKEKLEALKILNKDATRAVFMEIYKSFVTTYAAQYHHLFTFINQGQKALFHCSAGKDRTGFAAYLILSALNVSIDEIMENFLESNNRTQALFERNKEHAEKMGVNPDFYATFRIVREEYLEASIAQIKDSYGTTEKFLVKVLNADFDAIRDHYLD